MKLALTCLTIVTAFIFAVWQFTTATIIIVAVFDGIIILYQLKVLQVSLYRPVDPSKSLVLITGASRGIGRATALHLASLGFTVLAGVRKEEDGDAILSASEQHKDKIHPLILDVTDESHIKNTYELVHNEMANFPEQALLIVSNAGFHGGICPLELVSDDHIRKLFDVNVFGALKLVQTLIPFMRDNGRLVLINSLASHCVGPTNGAYSMTKAAGRSMADSLRMELKPWMISVSSVEPGLIATDMVTASKPACDHSDLYPYVEAFSKHGENHRAGKPESVAKSVAHALTSRLPHVRYQPGTGGTIAPMLKFWLADRGYDTMMLREAMSMK